ncbi:hypothetical protein GQ42DRAFT_154161 [Ramicandelaber brevisporus]|nr:hypothetical protein GQ42DRAFT_154161 [Ramicandelaber brevisporus]
MKVTLSTAAVTATILAAVPSAFSTVLVYSARNFGGAIDSCDSGLLQMGQFGHTLDGRQFSVRSNNPYVTYMVYSQDRSFAQCVDSEGWGNISSWPTLFWCMRREERTC